MDGLCGALEVWSIVKDRPALDLTHNLEIAFVKKSETGGAHAGCERDRA